MERQTHHTDEASRDHKSTPDINGEYCVLFMYVLWGYIHATTTGVLFSLSVCTVKLSACPSFFSQLLNMHLIFAVNLISAWHNILSNQLTYWKSNYFYSDYLQLMQQAYSSPKTTNMYSVIKKIWYINISDISYKDLCHHVVIVQSLISSSYYLYVMPLKPELVRKGCRSVFIYQQSSSHMMILKNRMWPKSPNMGM